MEMVEVKELKSLENLHFDEKVVLNYKDIDHIIINKKEIEKVDDEIEKFIEIHFDEKLIYEINFDLEKIYIWRENVMLLSRDVKNIIFDINDNNNVCAINIF